MCQPHPKRPIEVFQDKLNNLEHAIRDIEEELVVAGDFNAKAVNGGRGKAGQ